MNRLALLAPLACLANVTPVLAQEDFRNLDRGHPLRTQDAYPLPVGEWEVETGLRAHLQDRASAASGAAELKAGVVRNLEFGLEVEGLLAGSNDETAGVEGFGAHATYGLSRETWNWPGVGLRGEVGSPGIGDAGSEGWSGTVDLLLTRSFDRLRLHANAGRQWTASTDGPDAWRVGIAVDYPVGLFSRAIMADLYATVPDDGGRADVWAEVGTRWQLTNTIVVDFGLGTRLDELTKGRGNLEFRVGLSHAFGIPGLVSVPPYPDPRLD